MPATLDGYSQPPSFPAIDIFDIVPNDVADLATSVRMIYVGTGGNISVIPKGSATPVLHKNVPSGSYLGPFNVSRVRASGTTATDLLGYV